MKDKILENEELKKKTLLLQKVEEQLKTEFIGIDEVIENTINNMRPWYLFPEIQDKPLVISLVGLTGVGKTEFCRRLAELLDLCDDMVYFNFAEINEMKSWEVEESFSNNVFDGKKNKIFVYDEFQYASTLDESGAERSDRTGMKPFWELIDNGKIHQRVAVYEIVQLKRIAEYIFRIEKAHHIELKNGVWTNSKECLAPFTSYELARFKESFNFEDSKNVQYRDDAPLDVDYMYGEMLMEEDVPIFLNGTSVNRLFNMYNKVIEKTDILDFRKKIKTLDIFAICELIEEIIKNAEKGYDMDFSQSIVFVLMNLDEAYEMSFNVSPDMSPDQFHKITKKLTIVDIKEALKRRFRNEQIARLGNLFMIYPSFSEQNFKDIISLLLAKYARKVMEQFHISIEYEMSINDLIYRDAVFPTHGVRPIISSVHEIIKTKLPNVLDKLAALEVKDIDSVLYSFSDGKIKAACFKLGNNVGEFEFTQNLRVDKHRVIKDKEEQTLTAVHESGHFVMYAYLTGKMPEKLCSTTVDKGTGGFMMKDESDMDTIGSKEYCMNNIKIALAGYVAEKMVFGDMKRTTGATEDLQKATTMASAMIRKYGFGSRPDVTTYLTGDHGTLNGMLIRDDSQDEINNEIRRIINNCMQMVETALKTPAWKDMLKGSALYLSENTTMPKEKMLEYYEAIPQNMRRNENKTYYQDCLSRF